MTACRNTTLDAEKLLHTTFDNLPHFDGDKRDGYSEFRLVTDFDHDEAIEYLEELMVGNRVR